MELNLKVDTIDASEILKFQDYYQRQKPVIIKGLVKNSPNGSAWNLDYLVQRLGDTEVTVFDNSISKITAYTTGDYTMKFREFTEIIRKKEDCHIRLFLFNAFKHCPDLSREFPCPPIFKGLLDKIGFMFFGGQNTSVRMHFDIDMSSVLHTQFEGKKRVILVSPEYNDLMYKTPFNTYSIADFEKTDESKFPGLKYVKGYDIMLEPGDSLFMPCGYWHYMLYLEGGFAVAYRRFAYGIKNTLLGSNYLTLKLVVDKLFGYMFRKKWVDFKTRVAIRRAERKIRKIEAESKL